MILKTFPYLEQKNDWPPDGRHILAQYDDDTVVVYQAYRPAIGEFAAANGYFGGPFSLNRMSWIKPNFLWMMYRSGWGAKPGQEVVLAIWLQRAAFDGILSQAVLSSFDAQVYDSEDAWRLALRQSTVRLQWDPDRSPVGGALPRRAIQLGLRGAMLQSYARDWIVRIEDISEFVREQHAQLGNPGARSETRYSTLVTPVENVYPVSDPIVAARIGVSEYETT